MDNEKKLYLFQFYPAALLVAAGLLRFLAPEKLPLCVYIGLTVGIILFSFLPSVENGKKFIRQRDVQFTLGMCFSAMFLSFLLYYAEGILRGPGYGFAGVYDLSGYLDDGLILYLFIGLFSPVLSQFFFRGMMPRLLPKAGGMTVILVPAIIQAFLEHTWTSFVMGLVFGWAAWVLGNAWPAIFMAVLSKTYLLVIGKICAGFEVMSFWRWFVMINIALLLLSVYFILGQIRELMTKGKLTLSLARRGPKKELISMVEKPLFWTCVAVFLIFCFF